MSFYSFNSSFLICATYNSNTMIATVTIGSRSYNYLISWEMWREWLSAESAGRFFNSFIRDFEV